MTANHLANTDGSAFVRMETKADGVTRDQHCPSAPCRGYAHGTSVSDPPEQAMGDDAVKVAGVTVYIPENVNFALSVSVVRTFLDSRGIEYQTATSTTELSTPDVGDQGKRPDAIESWEELIKE